MFWCAEPQIVEQRKSEAALEQMVHLGPLTSWRDLLGPGNIRRLSGFDRASEDQQWEQLADELSASSNALAGEGDSEEPPAVQAGKEKMIYNIRHVAGEKLGHLTQFCPTLLRGSVLWSQLELRPLLGEEHLCIQGVPAVANGRFRPSWGDLLPSLSQKELRALAGNSIHSMIAGALTLWVLAAYVPREVRIYQAPAVQQSDEGDSEGELGHEDNGRVQQFAGSSPKRRKCEFELPAVGASSP
jgi:hypothetical protein